MHFLIIASGSKGNATIIANDQTAILIDMGISLTRLNKGLSSLNLQVSDLKGAFFTHDHCDHISGIKFLSPRIMYALEGTLPSSLSNVININETIKVGSLEITPFAISHDAKNPCGFYIKDQEESLVYMTDTGIFVSENLSLIKNPTYLIIESNHDIKTLLNTNRTFELKNRIMSEKGHLCNEDSALACLSIIGSNTKEIVLAHLSEEANTPDLALMAYEKIFNHFHININKYKITCAKQNEMVLGGSYPREN